jgi:hypothetical protein
MGDGPPIRAAPQPCARQKGARFLRKWTCADEQKPSKKVTFAVIGY